jgi:hypothetical protein
MFYYNVERVPSPNFSATRFPAEPSAPTSVLTSKAFFNAEKRRRDKKL